MVKRNNKKFSDNERKNFKKTNNKKKIEKEVLRPTKQYAKFPYKKEKFKNFKYELRYDLQLYYNKIVGLGKFISSEKFDKLPSTKERGLMLQELASLKKTYSIVKQRAAIYNITIEEYDGEIVI